MKEGVFKRRGKPGGWHYYIRYSNGKLVLQSARTYQKRDENGNPLMTAQRFWTEGQAKRAFLNHKEQLKWMKIWAAAIANMPVRRTERVEERWVARKKKSTPLPTFVEANARGKMMIQEGIIYELQNQTIVNEFGQTSLLGKLMGCYTSRYKGVGPPKFNNMAFYNARTRGYAPKDPKKQKLAMFFAGPYGNQLAWRMLRKLKRAHLYAR